MHGSEVRALSLGHPMLDDYLAFVGARARVNTWLATAYDLKVFFTVVGKEPTQVATSDVFAFLKAQRAPRLGGTGGPAGGRTGRPGRSHDRPAAVECVGTVRLSQRTW